MSNRIIIIVIVLIVSFANTAKAQNFLIPNDHSRFHAGAQLTTSTFENIVALLPGYTYDGKLTLGVDIGKGNDKLNFLKSTIIRPHIGYLLIKQDGDKFPVSINVEAAYQYNILTTTSEHTRSVQLGIGIFYELPLLEELKIIPFVSFFGSKVTVNALAEGETFIYKGGFNLVWQNYYITPSYLRNNGLAAISLNVGLLFGK